MELGKTCEVSVITQLRLNLYEEKGEKLLCNLSFLLGAAWVR